MSGRLIAVGDIHGEAAQLNIVLRKLALTAEDTLVFLGDYVDRGPAIPATVHRLIQLKKEFPNTIFLRGNHEQMMLESMVGPKSFHNIDDIWHHNGGQQTLEQYYNGDASRLEEHLDFLMDTQMKFRTTHEGRDYYFSHAGFIPWLTLEEQYDTVDNDTLLWERYSIKNPSSTVRWGDSVSIVGHTPLKKALNARNLIGIDTGACFGRYLTAVILGETRQFVFSNDYKGKVADFPPGGSDEDEGVRPEQDTGIKE